jgi:peptide/nickel transport system ATP-binding protein
MRDNEGGQQADVSPDRRSTLAPFTPLELGDGRQAEDADTPEAAISRGRGERAKAGAGRPAGSRRAGSAAQADRPRGIDRPVSPDDLKLISGVGPKIEGILNGLGIYRYEQIAGWKKAERAWVDDYLRFRGRIEREDWVRQAKALAKGGEAEYIRVFGKKPR